MSYGIKIIVSTINQKVLIFNDMNMGIINTIICIALLPYEFILVFCGAPLSIYGTFSTLNEESMCVTEWQLSQMKISIRLASQLGMLCTKISPLWRVFYLLIVYFLVVYSLLLNCIYLTPKSYMVCQYYFFSFILYKSFI